MDKRYQVFVSSTFTDIQEERRKVIQALMKTDAIPAFSAANISMDGPPVLSQRHWRSLIHRRPGCHAPKVS